jgi:GT2 family glycosyltransferase
VSAAGQTPLVYILLLNYKAVGHTLACLASLTRLNYPAYQVVVIDNASEDGSVEALKASQYDFHLIQSGRNLGYSGGNNLGVRYALEQGADYVWLLNNDTTVDPEALTALVAQAQKTGGLVGSLLLYPDGRYQQVGTVIRWGTGSTKGIPEGRISDGMAVPCLTGASLLIPRAVLERIGLLDESYFLYFEDGEYTLRANRAGFSATVALGSRVFHEEGASTGRKSPRTQYYYHRNRLKLLYRYAAAGHKMTIGLYTAVRFLRSIIKAVLSLPSLSEKARETRRSLRIQWLAIGDFVKGVEGPCPHNL